MVCQDTFIVYNRTPKIAGMLTTEKPTTGGMPERVGKLATAGSMYRKH
jgi:hypothetical protein